MNETEPSAQDTAALEMELTSGKVRVLFYNSQVTGEETAHLRALADSAHVPVVGVTETRPPGKTFVQWIEDEIDATEKALAGPAAS